MKKKSIVDHVPPPPPKIVRKKLPPSWLNEPRACGANGVYVDCPYFHVCCVKHDIGYDNAVLFCESAHDFAAKLKQVDDAFARCLLSQIKLAPLYLRPYLHAKRVIFLAAVTLWRKYASCKVRKNGGVENTYYK